MTAKISRYNRLTKEYWCVSLLHDSLYRSQDKGVQVHFAALWILTTCHLKLNKANLRLGEEGMWTIYLVRKVCVPSSRHTLLCVFVLPVTDYCNQKSQLKFNVDGNSGTLFFVGFSSIRCSL